MSDDYPYYTLEELTNAYFSGTRLRQTQIRVIGMSITDTPIQPEKHDRLVRREKDGAVFEFELKRFE